MSANLSWRSTNKALLPLLVALVLTVFYKLGDNYVVNHLILSSEKVIVSMVYLTLGALIGLAVNYILCQTPLGKVVDNSFTSIHGMSAKAHWIAFLAGIFGAASTGIYLYSMTLLDPSLVVPLTSLAVLYIYIIEVMRGKVSFIKILPSILLVILGVGVASFVTLSKNWSLISGVLALILIGNNGFSAIGEIISKDAIDSSDSISFNFWRFFWLTVSGILISIALVIYLGKFDLYLTTLYESVQSGTFLLVVTLIMVVVFFAQGFASKGIGLSNPTEKNVVMTGTIVFSVFATLFASFLFPQWFTYPDISGFDWFLRVVGAGLLTWGILRIRKL